MAMRRLSVGVSVCVVGLTVGFALAQAKPEGSEGVGGGVDQWERQNQAVERQVGPVEIRRDVVYATVNGKALTLDVFVPKVRPKPGEIRPLVIWVHGGGWKEGDKEPCYALFLVKHGYAVASINYRLTGEATFPAQIWDCKAAVRFLRAKANEYGYDGGAIGVMGGSAGGHLAALMGTTNNHAELEGREGDFTEVSSNVQAVCDWFGATNLAVEYFNGKEFPREHVVPMDPEKVLNTDVNTSTPKNELTDFLGGPPTRVMEKARLASPILQVSKDDPAFLVMHGDQDNVVPVYQSRMFVQKLKEAQVPVEYVEIPGAGHGGGQFVDAERVRVMQMFFDKYLRKIDAGVSEREAGEKPKPKGTMPKVFNVR